MMGRRHHTTSLTSPVLALALAGCDKAVESVTDSTDTSDTDAPKGWLRRFIDKVTDFDTPSDYGIAGGVAIGTVAVVGAAAGGGDSATSGGGASNPTPTNPIPTNTAPVFGDDGTGETIAENSPITTTVYTAPAVTDPDANDTKAYAVIGTDSAYFNISTAGIVTFKATPDFEVKSSYMFMVQVTDSEGATDTTGEITVTLTNVVENPSFASSTATGATIAENSPLATAVYTAPVATADMNGSVTYSVVGTDATYFTIDQSTRKVTFSATPNYETKSSYKFKVRATDDSDTSKYTETDEITVTLTNLDDNTPVLATGTTTSVNENVAANDSATAKGSAFVIYNASTGLTDADGSGFSHTYSLAAADLTTYGIDSSTGEVWFRASPDYEQRASIDLDFTVTVTDTNTDTTKNSASKTVTVTVTDVNESAVFTVTGSVNASNKGVLTAEKLSDDPEGNGTFAYQWQRADTNSATDSDWTDIASATGTSYTPVDGTGANQDTDKYLRLEITYTDTANNAHTIYDQITKGGGASNSGVIKHRASSQNNDSTSNADIFTTDASSGNFDVVQGGDGDDTLIYSYSSSYLSPPSISGGNGHDLLIGGTGNEQLYGNAGNDILRGRTGHDHIDGGAGVDIMTGGDGNDDFVLELTNRGKDAVTDFASGDDIEVDVTGTGNTITVNTLALLKADAKIDWTNNTKETTGTTTNDASINDTVIYYLGADGAWGGTGANADEKVMVLEDFTADLTFANFDIV